MGLTIPTLLEKCSNSDWRSQIFKKIAWGGLLSIPSSKLNGFDHSYIARKVLQFRLKIANLQKNRLGRAAKYTFLKIKWVWPFLDCWKSAPIPTEDRKSSKKIRLRRAAQYSFLQTSKLNGLDHCYMLHCCKSAPNSTKNLKSIMKLKLKGYSNKIAYLFDKFVTLKITKKWTLNIS